MIQYPISHGWEVFFVINIESRLVIQMSYKMKYYMQCMGQPWEDTLDFQSHTRSLSNWLHGRE
jgi:hypothetical protein